MDRTDLLSQDQRLLAHRLRNLEYSRKERGEPQQSDIQCVVLQWWYAIEPALYALQRAECCGLRWFQIVRRRCRSRLSRRPADLYGGRAVLFGLRQLLAEQTEQLLP